MSKPSWLHLSIGWLLLALGQPARPESPQKDEKAAENSSSRSDLYGDPLPAGSVARMGTVRWRHAQAVSFVAFLPDGKSVLTASQDQVVRLWDVNTGKEIRRFGKPLATAQEDGFIGNLRGRFRLAKRMAIPFHSALSSDGKLLVTGRQDGPIILWEVETGKEIGKINGPEVNVPGAGIVPGLGGVHGLALAPDSKAVAGTSMDGTIHLWETSTGKEIRQIAQPENQNMPVALGSLFGPLAFTSDGKGILDSSLELANGNMDSSLRLWDIATGKKRYEVKGKTGVLGQIRTAAFSPDGKFLACNSLGGTLLLLNAQTGEQVRELTGSILGSLIFSPDSKTLVTVSMNNHAVVQIRDVQTGKELRTLGNRVSQSLLLGFSNLRDVLAFSPDGKILAVGQGHALRLMDITSGKDVFPLEGNQAAVSRVHFSIDGKSVFTRCEDGRSQEWNSTTGRELREILRPRTPLSMAIESSLDGRTFATGQMNNCIQLWNATSGKMIETIQGDKTGFSAFAFSPDGKELAVQEMESPLVHLHDAGTGKEIRRLEGPAKGAAPNQGVLSFLLPTSMGLIYSSDGKRLAASIDGKSIGVWSTETGKQVGLFQPLEASPLLAATFSPDNRMLAIASEGDRVILWEIASGQVRLYLGGKPKVGNPPGNPPGMVMPPVAMGGVRRVRSSYSEAATNLTFSPDGKVLCQARSDQKIAIWETATSRELGQLAGHQGEITSLAFSPNGKQLASGSSDTTTLLWNLTDRLAHLQTPRKELTDREIEARWGHLAGGDAARAYESVCLLSIAPQSTVSFLRKRLRPAQVAEAGQIEKLINELDNNQFDVRQKASGDLERLGELAIPAARKALQGKPSAEMRRRLEQLLSAVDGRVNLSGGRLQTVRTIEVLERIGTPEARHLLQSLACGAPGALQTEEAKDTLQRLSRDEISKRAGKSGQE